MRTGLRLAWLFAAYGAIGFGGDYVVGSLLAHDGVDGGDERKVTVDTRNTGPCSFTAERSLTVSADGVSVLNIDAGSGALHVEGRPDLVEIRVTGSACASREEDLTELRLTVDEGPGGEITLSAHYPERRDRALGDNTARIDLTVLIPRGMDVDLDDSSGDLEVSGTGDLRVDDSSGSIRVYGIDGSVSIDDSSGGLELWDVSGDVEIEDGSGGLEVRDIRGSLRLRDGSGGIAIADVEQDVLIESDGSGGIEVRGVGGDFVVALDRSGGIRHSDVRGRVEIPVDPRRRRGGD
jgi:hypothetical protein